MRVRYRPIIHHSKWPEDEKLALLPIAMYTYSFDVGKLKELEFFLFFFFFSQFESMRSTLLRVTHLIGSLKTLNSFVLR